MNRYWVHVSPQVRQPRDRATAIGSADSRQETWTTYSGQPAMWASFTARLVASASVSGGRVAACQRGSVLPSASACLTSTSIASPFSAWTMTSAPVRAATCIVRNSVSSSTMIAPL